MRQIEKNKIMWEEFPSFSETGLVKHAFTTRIGGVSKGFYSSMNLGLARGENRLDTLENYRRIAKALEIDCESFVMSKKQVHGTKIHVVREQDRGKGLTQQSDLEDIDGLATDVPGIALVTFHADCVPLFFLDTEKKAIALAHAGWRGTVSGIAAKTAGVMAENFGTNPKKLLVGIGPSIGVCCFQVDEPVVRVFRQKYQFADDFLFPEEELPGKYKMDLWGINKRLLEEYGVPAENIEVGNLCTMCRPDLFYSHRVMGENRGTMAAILCLNALE